jgi:hypothetical protein
MLNDAIAESTLIDGRQAKANGPAKFLDVHARVSLFEETKAKLIDKFGLFHRLYSPKLADFVLSL